MIATAPFSVIEQPAYHPAFLYCGTPDRIISHRSVHLATAGMEFDAGAHVYRVNGVRQWSVTQTLEDVGIINYSHIPMGTRTMALWRGRCVHEITHFDDEGDLDDGELAFTDPHGVTHDLTGYLRAWRQFRDGFQFGDAEWLIDIKTNHAEWWVRCQLAAYAAIADPQKPARFRRLAVELHGDGTYTPIPNANGFSCADTRHDFETFLAALRVAREKEAHRKEYR